MINKETINRLYKIHNKPNRNNIDELLAHFMNSLNSIHNITLNNNILELHGLDKISPFRKIKINRIYGIEFFDKTVALILPSCILFFDKRSASININIKLPDESLLAQIKYKIRSVFSFK